MNPELLNPYFPSARRWGIGFGLCLVVAVGGGTLGLVPPAASILIGTLGGTSCLIFWFSLWLTGHSLEGELEAFRQGKALDRWELTVEDYRRWWEAQRRALSRGGLAVGAMLLLMGAVLGLLVAVDAHQPAVGASILGASLVLGAGAALVIPFVLSGPPPREEGSYTLWIGRDLAILNGQVRRWQGPGLRLDRAEALDSPPRLRVCYKAAIKGGWAEQVVELPAIHLAAAQAVADQIGAARRD